MLMGAPSSWYIALVGAILIIFLVLSELMKKIQKTNAQIEFFDKKT
jgi:ribose/xylose/arabinose/galactoside ABC-type transport system permease subunit